jgi:phage tail-like protein
MDQEEVRYPPVGFSFTVDFVDLPKPEDTEPKDGDKFDAEFQSITGLSVDLETEEFAEGGQNRFKHKLPTRAKYPNLVLKRGLLSNSNLIKWCRDAIENGVFTPVEVNIVLLNPERQPLMAWNLTNVYPIKWNVDTFNAEESKIVIETIECSYNSFTITKS